MRRRTFDLLLSTAGAVMTVVLLAAGALLLWAYTFTTGQVHDQLSSQQIYFPQKGSQALASPKVGPYLNQYAGEQLTNGAQAEAYANHFIRVHLSEVANGQTYAQVSSQVQQLKATNPSSPQLAKLQAEQQTLFQGNTLRGLLLNAYAFWQMGRIALWAAIASLALAIAMGVLSALGFRHAGHVAPTAEVLAPRQAEPAAAARR